MAKYISLSGKYGINRNTMAPFETPQDIINDMDRLGIWQTVVEYPRACNALYTNKNLLEEIKKVENYKERIIPSFVVDLYTVLRNDTLAELVKMMRENKPCCVTLQPKNFTQVFSSIEHIVEKLTDEISVFFIDYDQFSAESDWQTLVKTANRFPKNKFVVRQFTAGGNPPLFDAMLRATNIYAEMGVFHLRDEIMAYAELFGIDHVLFSAGPFSVGGANQAMITYTDISEEDKNKVRYGNFISLFNDEEDRKTLTKNLKEIPNKVKNSLWTDFVSGKGIKDVELYDSHTHISSTGCNWIKNLTFEDQITSFEKDAKRFNIKKIMSAPTDRYDLIQANIDNEVAMQGKEDTFRGYVRFSPHFAKEFTDEYFDKLIAGEYFIGLKALPHYLQVEITDERYDTMFAYPDKHKLPVLLHTWGGTFGSPKKCLEASKKWPNAKIIFGHTGGNEVGIEESIEIGKQGIPDNVWFETWGSFPATTKRWSQILKHIDYRKVLYGTDAPIHEISWELGRILSDDIDDEKLIAILGGNAKKLFGF